MIQLRVLSLRLPIAILFVFLGIRTADAAPGPSKFPACTYISAGDAAGVLGGAVVGGVERAPEAESRCMFVSKKGANALLLTIDDESNHAMARSAFAKARRKTAGARPERGLGSEAFYHVFPKDSYLRVTLAAVKGDRFVCLQAYGKALNPTEALPKLRAILARTLSRL